MAWVLATGAAVTLSWWGVHTVMSGTAYDPPLAVPLAAARPLSSSTHRALPDQSPSPSESPATASASPSPSGPSADPSVGKPSPKPPASPRPGGKEEASGKVQAYPVSGGRVVFSLGTSSAELVSATPAAGWRMQVWKQDYWIRVTFTKDGREVSVFCTWHDHPPQVETVDP